MQWPVDWMQIDVQIGPWLWLGHQAQVNLCGWFCSWSSWQRLASVWSWTLPKLRERSSCNLSKLCIYVLPMWRSFLHSAALQLSPKGKLRYSIWMLRQFHTSICVIWHSPGTPLLTHSQDSRQLPLFLISHFPLPCTPIFTGLPSCYCTDGVVSIGMAASQLNPWAASAVSFARDLRSCSVTAGRLILTLQWQFWSHRPVRRSMWVISEPLLKYMHNIVRVPICKKFKSWLSVQRLVMTLLPLVANFQTQQLSVVPFSSFVGLINGICNWFKEVSRVKPEPVLRDVRMRCVT